MCVRFCAFVFSNIKPDFVKKQDVMTLSDSDDVQTISSGSDDNKEKEKITPGIKNMVLKFVCRLIFISYFFTCRWVFFTTLRCDQEAGGRQIYARLRPKGPRHDGENRRTWRRRRSGRPGRESRTAGTERRGW